MPNATSPVERAGADVAGDAGLWHTLHTMEVRRWYDVNLNGGRTLHEMYAEDGVFAVGPTRHEGRETIRLFYEARAKRGIRTARHVLTNFQVLPGHRAGHVRAVGIISLYAGDAAPPLPSKPAVLMADLDNEYLLGEDGVWRYRSHLLKPVFVGDDAFVRHALAPAP